MKVRNLTYHVETYGEGHPLLLLHGFTGSSENWYPFVEQLSQHYHVILVDLIGHGKTEKPPNPQRYQMHEVVADLNDILDELSIESVNILGYSMGGRTALSYAMTFPDRVNHLILESSSPGLKTDDERKERRERDKVLADKIEKEGTEWFVERWTNIPLFASQKRLSEAVKQRQYQQRLKNEPHGLANSLRGMGTGSQPSWWEKLSELSASVLLITGDEDEKFCNIAEEMTKILKNAKNIVVNEAGHAIHVEQPQIFAKIVVDDLKEHLK